MGFRFLQTLRFGSKLVLFLGLLSACERIPDWERQAKASKESGDLRRWAEMKRWLWTCRATIPAGKEEAAIGTQIDSFLDIFRSRGLSVLEVSDQKTLLGSALLWNEEGYLLSAGRDLKSVSEIECSPDGSVWNAADLKGRDPVLGINLLKMKTPLSADYRASNRWMIREEPTQINERLSILAASFPGQLDQMETVAQPKMGTLYSGLDEDLQLFLPAPAMILNGGVLVDSKLRVVGVNLKLSESQIWGVSLKIQKLQEIVNSLMRQGALRRPFIGMRLRFSSEQGFLVQQVEVGGPAHQAGLRVQDEMLSWDNHNLKSLPDWHDLASEDIGRNIPVVYRRGSKTVEALIPVKMVE